MRVLRELLVSVTAKLRRHTLSQIQFRKLYVRFQGFDEKKSICVKYRRRYRFYIGHLDHLR